jgi:phosphoribosylglycinamide formyltransferase-1
MGGEGAGAPDRPRTAVHQYDDAHRLGDLRFAAPLAGRAEGVSRDAPVALRDVRACPHSGVNENGPMTRPDRRLRVGVLLGERPDLLRTLLDMAEIEVVAVARDRPEADAPAPAGVSAALFGWWPERGPGARERREAGIAEWFLARDVGLVVSAGWLWLLTPRFLAVFGDRIVNVHPTLLPAFPGRHSVERAVDHGVRVHGVTVHRIDEGVDTGPILAQATLAVDDGADAAEVRRRLAPLERRVLAETICALAAARPPAGP